MEDSGEMVEPVGSGKVYARAEGKEQSASPPSSTVTSCVIHCLNTTATARYIRKIFCMVYTTLTDCN